MNSRRIGLIASFILGVAVTTSALAQAAPRYPWDMTDHPTCSQPGKEKYPWCIAIEDWPDFRRTRDRIKSLYESERYTLLERALRETAASNKRFADGEYWAAAAYWAFRTLMPAPGAPGFQAYNERWRAAVPSSHFVAFAEARQLYANAWNVRGTGYAGNISPESWELYHLRLQQAEQVLLDAPAQLKDTPLWHHLLLAITQDTSRTKHNPDEVFEQAVGRWPTYFDFYEVRLTRLVPYWGGSWQKVEAFISDWTDRLSASEGSSMYARLYVSLWDRGPPHENSMDWNRMRKSFEDLISRYPAPKFKNNFAAYACAVRDKSAFGAAMQKISAAELIPQEWLSGHSYDACMRWATV